ncbi:hypothetical protein Tco_0484404 [Tanacetum coccineum]
MNFSVFNFLEEDSVGKPLYNRFIKTNDFKGVPHPLSGDYTPTPQKEIDESLYVYGKKGPQEPEPSVSDDRSSEYSTCQSNDSARSIGTSSEHSVDPEYEISRKMAREAEFKKQRVFNTGNGVAKPEWTNTNRINHTKSFCSSTVTTLITGQYLPGPQTALFLKNTDKPNVKGVGYRWMFDIDYLTDSMNYIPVSLENQANPHAGASEVTNSAGTSQTPNAIASEEKDEDAELIVVPSAVKNTEEKVESRKSSTNSKKEEILTEPQLKKEAFSTDTLEDNPKILAFRRELEEIALKHLGTVSENNSTSTPSVNTGRLDPDDSPMPKLEIFHKSETGIFDEASYDEEGVITDFNSLPTEIEVSPTLTLRIHNIQPKSQILGDPKSDVQTRSKVQQKSGAHALFSYIQKQQRSTICIMKNPVYHSKTKHIEIRHHFIRLLMDQGFIS